MDAGWLVREPNLGLTFGAAVSNYGTGIKYRAKTEALPSILRFGLSYQRPTVMDQSVLLSLEHDYYMNESLKSLRAGLEYHFEKYFNFRLGYKTIEDNSGMTMGLGIRHEGFALDFAMSLANEIFNTSQVSFSYKFTNWRPIKHTESVQYRDQEEVRPQPRKAVKPVKKVPAKPRKSENIPANKDSDFFMLY